MLSGILILKVAGRNVRYDHVTTPIRNLIIELGDEDVASMQVERVFLTDSMASPIDETAKFASAWGLSLDPAEPVPAFVRFHCPTMAREFAA